MTEVSKIRKDFEYIINDCFKKFKQKYIQHCCKTCKAKEHCKEDKVNSEVLQYYMIVIKGLFSNKKYYLSAKRKGDTDGIFTFSLGKSMMPTLKDNYLLMVLPRAFIKQQDLRKGDCVELRYSVKDNKTNKEIAYGNCMHRIIGIQKREGMENQYETKGDNNKISDGWSNYSDIHGILVGYIPFNGIHDGRGCIILRPDLLKRCALDFDAKNQELRKKLKVTVGG